MTSQASAYCTSCGEQTATPPECEDCRAQQVDHITWMVDSGAPLPNGHARWLLAEIGRLRDTIHRRADQHDAERVQAAVDLGAALNARDTAIAERDDAREAWRYHQNKRSEEAREIAALTIGRDGLAAQVQAIRDWAHRMETEAPKPAAGGFFADEVRSVLGQVS